MGFPFLFANQDGLEMDLSTPTNRLTALLFDSILPARAGWIEGLVLFVWEKRCSHGAQVYRSLFCWAVQGTVRTTKAVKSGKTT